MGKRILIFILLFLVVSDLTYSFVQHLQMPLDGDMAESILPAKGYENIFQDPLGISVYTQNAIYPNPNRFFAQWTYAKYFQHFPFLIQKFTSPIESIYYASAIAKTVIQLSILLLLGFYITGHRKILTLEFLISMALITPFFQTNGYRSYMGIIDPSITYTFSYALPCALLLLFYLPFFNVTFYQKSSVTNKILLFLLFLFTIVLTLNGPLIPGAVLIISLLYILHQLKLNYSSSSDISVSKNIFEAFKKIPRLHFIFFSIISIFSLYSLSLGGNNSQFINEKISIYERYLRLPEGLYYLLTQKIGYPLLLLAVGINIFIIHKTYNTARGLKIIRLTKWIGLFSLIFILLLPLGGYRSYRPYIIRYDSIMPITIALIFIYGLSTVYLLDSFTNIQKKIYILGIIVVSFVFTYADELDYGKNQCEKIAFHDLSQSKENCVFIKNDCTVLAWDKITDPENSALNGQLLQFWGITADKKLYYQK